MIRNVEEIVCAWDEGALIHTVQKGDGKKVIQPAAFVYATRGGVAWIELSGEGLVAMPSKIQIRKGEIILFNDGLMMTSRTGERIYIFPFESDNPETAVAGHAIKEFANKLKRRGVTWQEERDRVRALVAKALKDLEPPPPSYSPKPHMYDHPGRIKIGL